MSSFFLFFFLLILLDEGLGAYWMRAFLKRSNRISHCSEAKLLASQNCWLRNKKEVNESVCDASETVLEG